LISPGHKGRVPLLRDPKSALYFFFLATASLAPRSKFPLSFCYFPHSHGSFSWRHYTLLPPLRTTLFSTGTQQVSTKNPSYTVPFSVVRMEHELITSLFLFMTLRRFFSLALAEFLQIVFRPVRLPGPLFPFDAFLVFSFSLEKHHRPVR